MNASKQDEAGVALILALWFTILVSGLVLVGTLNISAHRAQTNTAFVAQVQAVQTARSGLTEALAWMRRQTSQPVHTFEPLLDPGATPPRLDTIEPDVGLVREFRIAGQRWARYEVWKDWPADPDAARLAWRQRFRCEDVSMPRMASAAGSIWRLRSLGYVFERNDPQVPFNQAPNRVLAREALETEVKRLSLNLPGEAAMNVGDGNSCHINTNGRIVGGSAGGIYYPAGTGTPTTGPPSQQRVTGTPSLSQASSYDDSYEAVFGVGLQDLRSLASQIVTDADHFPQPVPAASLVIVEVSGSMHFTASNPLLGGGIVVVVGNCTIAQGSNSNFSGLLYVEGNLTMRAPSEIRGGVVVTGNTTLQGNPDYATVQFDEPVLNDLRVNFGNYKLSNTVHFTNAQDN